MKTQPPKAGKQGLWNKIVIAMLDGRPKTPEELKEYFKDDPKIYYFIPKRLSTVCWQLKTFEGAIIKVTKIGKRVTSYQLVNYKDFDTQGFGPLRQTTIKVKSTEPSADDATELVDTENDHFEQPYYGHDWDLESVEVLTKSRV